jgi:hypothetical protein
MSLISFLTSAAGGTILGGATQLLAGGISELKEWSASKRRIAEIAAIKEKQIAVAEMEAYSKALGGTLASSYQPPINAPMAMHWLFTLVECLTRVIRPAMVIGACAYIWSLPGEKIGDLQTEIVAVSFACIYFWLGIRQQMKK